MFVDSLVTQGQTLMRDLPLTKGTTYTRSLLNIRINCQFSMFAQMELEFNGYECIQTYIFIYKYMLDIQIEIITK